MCLFVLFFFFKQKTAYEMRISDWSSDVCSSDLSIKILATIPRRKDISEQQFHDHWRHPHGPLSKKIACLRGYVQSHRIVSPLLPDTKLAYDGITELWYDSLDDAPNMGNDPAHRKYTIPDEPMSVDIAGLQFTFFPEAIHRT